MLSDLLKSKIEAGARHFADMPEVAYFDEMYDHAENLKGAEINDFAMDGVIEMWLEFDFRGQRFFIGNQFGDYWFLVENAECPDEILLEVTDHFRELTER